MTKQQASTSSGTHNGSLSYSVDQEIVAPAVEKPEGLSADHDAPLQQMDQVDFSADINILNGSIITPLNTTAHPSPSYPTIQFERRIAPLPVSHRYSPMTRSKLSQSLTMKLVESEQIRSGDLREMKSNKRRAQDEEGSSEEEGVRSRRRRIDTEVAIVSTPNLSNPLRYRRLAEPDAAFRSLVAPYTGRRGTFKNSVVPQDGQFIRREVNEMGGFLLQNARFSAAMAGYYLRNVATRDHITLDEILDGPYENLSCMDNAKPITAPSIKIRFKAPPRVAARRRVAAAQMKLEKSSTRHVERPTLSLTCSSLGSIMAPAVERPAELRNTDHAVPCTETVAAQDSVISHESVAGAAAAFSQSSPPVIQAYRKIAHPTRQLSGGAAFHRYLPKNGSTLSRQLNMGAHECEEEAWLEPLKLKKRGRDNTDDEVTGLKVSPQYQATMGILEDFRYSTPNPMGVRKASWDPDTKTMSIKTPRAVQHGQITLRPFNKKYASWATRKLRKARHSLICMEATKFNPRDVSTREKLYFSEDMDFELDEALSEFGLTGTGVMVDNASAIDQLIDEAFRDIGMDFE
ncbi:hypothetical protein BC829DRAFT_442458 [Chytridium lagenaria]|nr:hypothetical protein BC829DRAFT_442458 [Chytridium lagenaria]